MLRNHLKIALRQLLKNKFITTVNLLGLVLGVMAALFIWQYVHYERSYDEFHEQSDQIYRVRTDRVENGVPFMQFAAGAAFAGKFLKDNFSEVADYVKLKTSSEGVFSTEDNTAFIENKVFYAMPSLFDVFDFSLVQGDSDGALEEPFTACLSESMAQKLFGRDNPIGQVVTRNGSDRYEITGVFADCPPNSHIKFNILLSYSTFSDVFYDDTDETETSPWWDGYYTYLLLQPGADPQALEAKIPDAIVRNYDEEVRDGVELYLQPLTDIHLTSNYLIEAEANGDGKAVYFLSIIGIIVLFIAWLNYINLSVARSILRAKEVGVRKVVGSSRKRLIGQFLTETLMVNLFAVTLALVLVKFMHPLFESLVGKEIPQVLFEQWPFFLAAIGVLLGGTLLSGIYPAFILSGFQPIQALRSNLAAAARGGNSWLQRSLVVIQFTASVALIAGTLIIYQQLRHLQNTDLGVNVDQTLVIKGPNAADSTFVDKARILQEEIEKLAMVDELTSSSTVPGQEVGWTAGGVQRLGIESEDSYSFHVMAAMPNYSEVYGMNLVAGRHMTEEMGTDRTACLLNEKGVALLEFESAEAAVGEGIEFWGEQFTVVGVIKDFHQESPKAVVEPLILRAQPEEWMPNFYSVKLQTQQLSSTLSSIEATWRSVFPGNPFEYFFQDEHFNKQYEADQRFGQIFTLFSIMAIVVSCLGLFALMAFIVERKKKEIGIRKVLGASVSGIVGLLSRDFMKLVIVALLIATPLAWYVMSGWLDNFAVRTDIQWWVFALAGVLAMLVAFATISFQSIRAALANPVNSLRSE